MPLVKSREGETPWPRLGTVAGGRRERWGADEFQGTGDRRVELVLIQPSLLLRDVEEGAEAVSLLAQGGLPLAGRFQFFFHGAPLRRFQVGCEDIGSHLKKSL